MWNKILISLLSITVLCGCTTSEAVTEPTIDSVVVDASSTKEVTTSHPSNMEVDKSETVLAKAKPDGSVYETTVEVSLKHKDDETIQDLSNLKDIKNTSSDEEYTMQDNELVWENKGSDIQYKGKSTNSLPVDMHVTYKLDDKEVKYESLKNVTGSIEITYTFNNFTKNNSTFVPFLTVTMLMLDDESCSNISIDNGSIINTESTLMVVGYTTPSLKNNFHLNEDIMDDIEFNDSFTVKFDANDYTLDYSATIITNGLFQDIEQDTIQELLDINSDINEFNDASNKLSDGITEFKDAMFEFKGYSSDIKDGIDALAKGSRSLTDGLKQVNDNMSSLKSGASTLNDVIQAIHASIETLNQNLPSEDITNALVSLSTEIAKINTYIETVNSSIESANTTIVTINSKIENDNKTIEANNAKINTIKDSISNNGSLDDETKQALLASVNNLTALDKINETIPSISIKDLSVSISSIQTSVATISSVAAFGQAYATLIEYTKGLAGKTPELVNGVNTLASAIGTIYSGANELAEGAGTLNDGYKEVNDGVVELADASQELLDGFKEYREEGVDELLKEMKNLVTLGQDLQNLKNADNAYTNFSGKLDSQESSVMFLIETDSLED